MTPLTLPISNHTLYEGPVCKPQITLYSAIKKASKERLSQ